MIITILAISTLAIGIYLVKRDEDRRFGWDNNGSGTLAMKETLL